MSLDFRLENFESGIRSSGHFEASAALLNATGIQVPAFDEELPDRFMCYMSKIEVIGGSSNPKRIEGGA